MLIIVVEGGVISEILTDGQEDNNQAVVVDYDVDEIEPEHLHDMPCQTGATERAIVSRWDVQQINNPAFVAKLREILG